MKILDNYKQLYRSEDSRFHKMSYIPIMSNAYGVVCVALGAFYSLAAIFTMISGIPCVCEDEIEAYGRMNGVVVFQRAVGFMLRGCVVQVPLIGNIAIASFDIYRKNSWQ
jgi:hypothetical protein